MKLYATLIAILLTGCSQSHDHRPSLCTTMDSRTGMTFEDEWEQCLENSRECKLAPDEYALARKCGL